MTHSYVWHDSFMRVTWLIHMCDMTHPYVSQEQYQWAKSITTCEMTHSYVWCDVFIFVAGAISMGEEYYSVSCTSLICVTWHIRMCRRSSINVRRVLLAISTGEEYYYVWCNSFICVTWLFDICRRSNINGRRVLLTKRRDIWIRLDHMVLLFSLLQVCLSSSRSPAPTPPSLYCTFVNCSRFV